MPDRSRLFAALEATWPAASVVHAGPWALREGRGGGQRVSAATAEGDWQDDDLAAAEKAMRLMGQTPLFMIRHTDEALDQALALRGYDIRDPVQIWAAPTALLTDRALPRVTAFAIWEPLAVMREIWEEGDIGEARQRVMNRVSGPKTGIFGRVSDKPAGAAFCAISDDVAAVHAMSILASHRKKGLGGWMMRCAAIWAQSQGATHIAVQATRQNAAANALYAALQMEPVGAYHYRVLNEAEG